MSESDRRFSFFLYNAVTQNDFDSMLRIYASYAIEGIASREFTLNPRFDSHYYRSKECAEEKRDESSNFSHSNIFPSTDGSVSVLSRILHDLTEIINNVNVKKLCTDADARKPPASTPVQSQSKLDTSMPFMPRVFESYCSVTGASLNSSLERSNLFQEKYQKKRDSLCRMKIGQDQAEAFLDRKAFLLSNSQPESSFAVYKSRNGTDENSEIKYTVHLHDEDQKDSNKETPTFDGTVANATPLNIEVLGGGGGSGTILHLACAIDSPFALAILLVLGADVQSSHTAFRRLILHEAACSDSHNCLRLLLEIGKKYSESARILELSRKGVWGEERKSSYKKSYRNFLRKPLNNKKRSISINSKGCDERKAQIASKQMRAEYRDGFTFVSTLQTISKILKQLQNDEISNYDAAWSLLLEIPLSERSRAFIAAACGMHIPLHSYSGLAMTTPKKNPVYDGHGNTPLHWASFKNAAACVDLLLLYDANPNAISEISGWTPLHDAAYSDSTESISLLLSAGADVNAKANSGATPLCFAAQEDAPNVMKILLDAGADAAARCCDNSGNENSLHQFNRFSGYTPLHYCAHYNSHQAARVLLNVNKQRKCELLAIPDINDKLSIHVAVSKGSSAVLRELLRGGARLDTDNNKAILNTPTDSTRQYHAVSNSVGIGESEPMAPDSITTQNPDDSPAPSVTPSSPPVLQAMIPVEPITSSKPWNCISQNSIDECKILLKNAEMNWTTERHSIFYPSDRRAIVELLRVGKRLEQLGTGIFLELWPLVLSFCGRGWFESKENLSMLGSKVSSKMNTCTEKELVELTV